MSLVPRSHECPICGWKYDEHEVRSLFHEGRACVRCDISLRLSYGRTSVDADDRATLHGEQLYVAPWDEVVASHVHALMRAVRRNDPPSITSGLRYGFMNGHGQRMLHAVRSLDKYPIILGYAASMLANEPRRAPWMDDVFRACIALIARYGSDVPPTFVADTLAYMVRAAVMHGGDTKVCPTARDLVREAYMLSERAGHPDVRRAILAVFEGIDQHALMQMGFCMAPTFAGTKFLAHIPLAIGDDGKIRPKEAPMSETKSNEKTPPPTRADQALAAVKDAADTAGKTLAAEGKAAAWQATTEQVVKRFHKRVLAKLQDRGVNGGVLAFVQEVMQTRVGLGIFSFLAGSGMSLVPRLQRKPLYARGASEMRTLGLRIVFGEVLEPIADLFEEVWDEFSDQVGTWPEDDASA